MAPTDRPARGLRPGDLLPLLLGILALAAGTAVGWDARVIEAVAGPPPIARALLVGASAVAAAALLLSAIARIERSHRPFAAGPADVVRGIRLAFLALAALSAGAGWLVGHPLPIVVGLIIAGVDVVETTFLLLVVAVRRDPRAAPDAG